MCCSICSEFQRRRYAQVIPTDLMSSPGRGHPLPNRGRAPREAQDPSPAHPGSCHRGAAAGEALHRRTCRVLAQRGRGLARADDRRKLERLCRYVARPPIALDRLSRDRDGDGLVVYELKHPFRDGTSHVVFEPLDLMAHIHVRHPSGGLRPSKSAVLPIGHCSPDRCGAAPAKPSHPVPRHLRPERASPPPRRSRTDTSRPSAVRFECARRPAWRRDMPVSSDLARVSAQAHVTRQRLAMSLASSGARESGNDFDSSPIPAPLGELGVCSS